MKQTLLIASIGSFSTFQTLSAALIWADDFSRGSSGTAVNPYNYPGGDAAADYGVVTTALLDPSGYVNIADTSSAAGTLRVESLHFSSLPTADGDLVIVTYDFRVNSMDANSSAASVPRFSIMNGSTAGGSEVFGVGFGYSNYTGNPNNSLGFFWGQGGASAVNAARGIGVGAADFNFGVYDAASANAASNDTNDLWYRITFTLAEASTAATGSISLLNAGVPTGTAANFSGILSSALDWSTGTADGIKITTGATGFSNVDFDNISIQVIPVPEPSVIGLAMLGSLGFFRRRR